jgi:hypothetical protein
VDTERDINVDNYPSAVPKWKKDATEFTVKVNFVEKRGYQANLPKPIIEKLGDPKEITFLIRGKRVEVAAGGVNTKGSSENE